MCTDLTSPSQSTNPSAMSQHCARQTHRMHAVFVVLVVTLFLALASRAEAQNVQYDDKALDLGSRSTTRIDPVSRGLNFEIPLGSYPGRGGLNVPVSLSYTSKVWNVEFQGYNPGTNPPYNPMQAFSIVVAQYAKHSVAGWTSSIGMPIVDNTAGAHFYNANGEAKPNSQCPYPCFLIDRKTIWMPDGSGHELRATDQPRLFQDPAADNYYSVDDSRMRYQASTDTLFLPDGSRYLVYGSQYIDRNGNKLTYGSGVWTDTLGRQVANPLPYSPGSAPAVGDQSVSLPGVGGTSISYVLKWRNLADVLTTPQSLRYTADGGCPPGLSGPFSPYLFMSDWPTRTCIANAGVLFNPVVLSQIVLPTGQAYTFTYNIYGEIDKVVMPTGAYEKYQYGTVSPITNTSSSYNQGNRGVISRTISSSGLAADEVVWTYSGTVGSTTIVGPAPENKRTEITFWTDENTAWGYGPNTARGGRVYDERTYNSSGQMLSRKMTDWAMTGSNANGKWPGSLAANRHARPVREVEFLLDTGGSALARTTSYTYDTTYQFTVGVERSAVRVYDFVSVDQNTAQTIAIASLSSIPNGTQLGKTATTYLTSDQNYRDRNFLGMPTSVSTYDGNDVLVAQTTFSYDEAGYPLISVGSPPYTGWTDPGTTVRANVTTTANWLNTSGTFLQTHTQYDQFGSVRKSWDAKQNLTQTDYSSTYAFAYPTQVTSPDPDGGGSAVALVNTNEYDFATGRITATVDANNQRTTFAYNDPLNRLKQVVRAATDTVANAQTTYVYDDVSRTITVTKDLTSFNDNLIKNQSVFDGLGRVVESRQYVTPTDFITVKTEYDALGRPFKRTNPYGAGESIAWTVTEYDWLGRVISITTPDSAVIRTAYAGDRVLNTDQAGKQRINKVNALGQLINIWEVTAADGATEAISFPSHPEVTAGYRTSYQYDALSNLVKVTQGAQQRYFMYDSLKRLIRMRLPEQGTNSSLNLSDPVTGNSAWSTGLQYDANGNLTQKTDARGVVSTYAYDALNRNTTIDFSDTVSINPDVKRFYDGATNGKGRFWYFYKGGDFSTGSNVEHTSVDSYDALGKPLVQRQLFKLNGVWSPTYQISRGYNRDGALTSQTYPSNHTITNSYDYAGRTNSFAGNLGDGTTRTYSSNITYSPFGGLSREQFGTTMPLYHKSFYNIRGQIFDTRLSSVNDTWDWNRGRLILYYSSNHQWGQSGTDNNGNVRFAENWVPPENATIDQADTLFLDTYNYDALNRLTSVVGDRMSVATGWGTWQQQFRQQYTYDRYGNRTIDAAQTSGTGINNKQFTVDSATNRLGVPGGQSGTMSYDLAGNLTNDTYTGAGVREYDAENKMTKAWGGNNQLQEYTYSADGLRTRRKIDGQQTWQIFGIDGELVAEYAANGATSTPQKEYGYRNGELLVVAEPAPAVQSTQNVSWTNAMGVSVSGNNLTKTAADNWANSGAASSQAIVSGDGYVEITASEANTFRMVGLSNGDSNQDYTDIDFAVYLAAGNLCIYEAGINRGCVSTFATGNVIRVAIEGGVVKYKKNGTVVYTSGVAPTYPLLADSALWSNGSTVNNAVISGILSGGSGGGGPQNVSYTNAVGVSVSGNNLTKTTADNWANSGASSSQSITSGDGYVEITATETNTFRMVGLSNGDSNQDYTDIDFAVYLAAANLCIYEAGVSRGCVSTFATGDVIRVAVESGVVKYKKNGTVVYTSGVAPTYPLLVDTALWNNGSTINNAVISGNLSGGGGSGAGGVRWLVTDQLGTPRMIVDQTGALATLKRHDYLPFGEELFAGRSPSIGYGGGDGVRQQFTSQERDLETGLDYFGARYHSSIQGRFTSVDPLLTSAHPADPQSLNRYSYVENMPTTLIDPNGMDDCYIGKTCSFTTNDWATSGNHPEQAQLWEVVTVDVTQLLTTTPFDPNSVSLMFPGAPRSVPGADFIEEVVSNTTQKMLELAAGVSDMIADAGFRALPDYFSADFNLPLMGGINLQMTKDGEVFGGINFLGYSGGNVKGLSNIKFRGSAQISAGYYLTPNKLSAEDRYKYAEGVDLNTSLSYFTVANQIDGGGPPALSVGFPSGYGVSTTGAVHLLSLRPLIGKEPISP